MWSDPIDELLLLTLPKNVNANFDGKVSEYTVGCCLLHMVFNNLRL